MSSSLNSKLWRCMKPIMFLSVKPESTHLPDEPIFGDRLSASGLAPKAVIGAVMRKLAHLIYGVIKSERPFDANFNHSALAIQDGI